MRFLRGRRAARAIVFLAIAAATVTACEQATPIPSGAQVVHVTVTPSEVRISPATVQAGDVYLVLDAPANGSVFFVSSKHTEAATPGPLTVAELTRLEAGDTQGTLIESIDSGHCDAGQNEAARGRVGPCGNAAKVVVLPGSYALFGGPPELDPARGVPPPMAVLEVMP